MSLGYAGHVRLEVEDGEIAIYYLHWRKPERPR